MCIDCAVHPNKIRIENPFTISEKRTECPPDGVCGVTCVIAPDYGCQPKSAMAAGFLHTSNKNWCYLTQITVSV